MNKENKSKIILAIIIVFVILLVSIFANNNDNNENLVTNTNNENQEYETLDIDKSLLNIFYLDVGQADSCLILLNDKVMLIDCGNNSDGYYITKFLEAQNINKIDYLIGTHLDEDHIGGMDTIINQIEIDKIYIPYYSSDDVTEYNEIKTAISNNKNSNLELSELNTNDKLEFSSAIINVLSAVKMDETKEINDTSIVLELEYINTNYLFMGDATTTIEEKIDLDKTIDVLKVGHHGSVTSSSEEFINKIKPKYSIISVDSSGTYKNLPNEEVITRLNNVNSQIYRTDKDGTIWINSDGDTINIQCEDIDINGANRKKEYSYLSIPKKVCFYFALMT